MTKEEVYNSCIRKLNTTRCLLLELPTGYGKTRLSIELVNYLSQSFEDDAKPSMLLLVAKNVHKQTWKEEFWKWGGINANVTMECYESLKKHEGKSFDIVVMDEVHHVGSDIRLELLSTLDFHYMIGLSATIPRNLKGWFQYKYHAGIVSCDLTEAIREDILPQPQIILFPLMMDNVSTTETMELNPKAEGPVVYGTIRDLWKFKKQKVHAIISCTKLQKLLEFNKLIEWEKKKYITTRREALKTSWLYHAGKRLEFLAYCKNDIVRDILDKLKNERTITFCKTIEQSEVLGSNCIHSQNKDAALIYNKFNEKKLNHITAVNILNENANLVDCKYAVFANLSSSDIIIPQRIGRSLRHKSPVLVIPFYKDTREEEIVDKMIEGYDRQYVRVITNINEI